MKNWKPHGYQLKGIRLLINSPGAGLLLDPGMGKTTTALAAFEILRTNGSARRMLVVAPIKPMYDTWPNETQKWEEFYHLRTTIIHGPKKKERLHEDTHIHIINPEALVWFLEQDLLDYDVICVDESTKFKNSTSKRFKALKKHLHRFTYRWILTGTVTPNGLIDLFGQTYIMDLGKSLGQYITHYRNQYFFQSGYGGYTYTPFPDSMDKIAEKVAPMVLKLDAEDYLQMPEFKVVERPIYLDEASRDTYRKVEKDFIAQVKNGTVVAANAAAAGTKCRQIANGAVYDETGEWLHVHDKKLEALEEIVEETNGHPLFILYEFDHDRQRIMEMLGKMLGKKAECITGVSGKRLTNIVNRFNKGELPYLVAHPGSTHGMNIQGFCYHMVWFGITWNLEHYIQAVWRLYRQGQGSNMVLCYHLIAKGTLDERVVEVLDHKQSNQDKLETLLMTYKGEEHETTTS